jgi:hypothetical protein
MKKKIAIILLISILWAHYVNAQDVLKNDTTLQSIYYQHNILTTKKVNVYLYSTYDLYYLDESGLSLVFMLPTHISIRDRKQKKKAEGIKWAIR